MKVCGYVDIYTDIYLYMCTFEANRYVRIHIYVRVRSRLILRDLFMNVREIRQYFPSVAMTRPADSSIRAR